ncbi:MAG: 2-polyprenyl-3-methyl-5-hydroxy-6-metoxy-1,4-benzoquinol methylase [Kiritimatiellia bacterium]|jgi:2-polyprenyl-3-methyl-5-hydroxy-6-metoxy-1,4-benzoquinol methylase
MSEHAQEMAEGKRFGFGENWSRFLTTLNDERIREAEDSLTSMLGLERLDGMSFLDIGSGSGLFSLVARRLGARVHSLDYDPQSVACTTELRKRYFPDDPDWKIEVGSVLDRTYIESLGTHDIVYSWGVLHHTGEMWKALEHAAIPTHSGSRLFIAIYNDQGAKSRIWTKLKQLYCSGPVGRFLVTCAGSTYFFLICLKEDLLRLKNPMTRYREYKSNRGMSIWYDWIDWFGGYPFEVARPDELFEFYHKKGFDLTKLVTVGGALGNSELVFKKR